MAGDRGSWPDDEVWRRLEQALGTFQETDLQGAALDDEGALDRTAAAARSRLEADPADFAAHRALAVLSALHGDTEGAMESMRSALQLDPGAIPPAPA